MEVIDYQESWIDKFNLEVDNLSNSIGFLNPAIHHIRSTAASGLSIKPIIDILIDIDGVCSLDDRQKNLEDLGYQ